jgi:DNA polymerase elongation subunit (family B)
MMQGFLLDCYPDHQKNMMVTWLKTKQGIKRIEQNYYPSFYVAGSKSNLERLRKTLIKKESVKQVSYTKQKTELGSSHRHIVLKVTPYKLISIHHLAQQIQEWGKYQEYILYNVDLRLSTRYLQDNNVFFNAQVTWSDKKFSCNDPQWSVDYQSPSFSQITFDLITRKSIRKNTSHKISAFVIDDIIIENENEVDTILSGLRLLRKKNPDIIITDNGDSFLFPFIHQRCLTHGIADALCFGRDNSKLKQVKQDSSYASYGKILYRPAWYIFHGRFHIDRNNSFFYNEGGFEGLLDVSRCSNISLQILSRLGAGTAISQMQVNTALNKQFLVPWNKRRPEQWKTASMLLCTDRGGLILDPVTGIHENVVEFDYASLYPHIMIKENISPETVLCSCCPNSLHRVPQLGYHICEQKIGLIPMVLKPIIDRRFRFKARAKNKVYDPVKFTRLQQAWKWILLVSFGYTGYKNARYGRIECHESITAFSRSILLNAMHLAEDYGYNVLHGIVDSLWVQANKPIIPPSELAKIISKRTGVRLDIEGTYDWIVFLKSKHHDYGALNRYYGRFSTGEMKSRGIELRQHNTPIFIKNMQKKMLQVFQQARSKRELKHKVPSVIDIVFTFMEEVASHKVNVSDLLITSRIARTIDAYKVNTFVKAALKQKEQNGCMLHPGQFIEYVVCDKTSDSYMQKVCVKERLSSDTLFDSTFYLQYVCRCAETVLLPFEITEEWLLERFLDKKDTKRIRSE